MCIIKWLKKYFIPHEHNEYKPHSLRTESAIFVLILILLIEVFFFADPFYLKKTNFFATILQNVLVNETNMSRESNELISLKENSLLDVAAKMKAEDMAKNGYFAHTSPAGIDPWHWFNEAGYKYSYAGENLAINFSDSEDVIKAWLNSPAHRANIMNQRFTEIGIGIAHGTYQNKETTFVVQMFGKPTTAPVAVVSPQTHTSITSPAKIAVNSTVTTTITTGTAQTSVLGETSVTIENQTPAPQSPWSLITSPNKILKIFYLILMVIFSIALLLNVFIEIKTQHLRLVLNGALLLFILNIVLLINNHIAFLNAAIF